MLPGGNHGRAQRDRGDQYLMAGADVVMSTAALLRQGPAWLTRDLAVI